MHWSEIVNAIIDVRCDVLTILNCCNAGAAMQSFITRPNYENHQKQVIMAVPARYNTNCGHAGAFAACLEQALRERLRSWEPTFQGLALHWVQAINRTMARKHMHMPPSPVGIGNLITPPANANNRPIILSPRGRI